MRGKKNVVLKKRWGLSVVQAAPVPGLQQFACCCLAARVSGTGLGLKKNKK